MHTLKTQQIWKVNLFQGKNTPKTNIVLNTAVQSRFNVKQCILESKYLSF